MARLSRRGLSPRDWAIAGSAVASTVESRFSMKSAQATISGITTWRGRVAMRGSGLETGGPESPPEQHKPPFYDKLYAAAGENHAPPRRQGLGRVEGAPQHDRADRKLRRRGRCRRLLPGGTAAVAAEIDHQPSRPAA